MFVSIVETVIVPVAIGFALNYALGKNEAFKEVQKVMPGVAVLGLACVVGGVISSQGSKFFQSGIVIFVAVLLHNGFGYFLGYCAGKLTGMNTAKITIPDWKNFDPCDEITPPTTHASPRTATPGITF